MLTNLHFNQVSFRLHTITLTSFAYHCEIYYWDNSKPQKECKFKNTIEFTHALFYFWIPFTMVYTTGNCLYGDHSVWRNLKYCEHKPIKKDDFCGCIYMWMCVFHEEYKMLNLQKIVSPTGKEIFYIQT